MDDQLKAYLDRHDLERREGFTIANVMSKFHQFEVGQRTQDARIDALESRVDAHDLRFDGLEERADRHGAAIVVIKRRLRTGDDDDDMATGQFNLGEVRRELEEARAKRAESERVKAENSTWLKRQAITWVGAAIGAGLLVILTTLVTLAIAGATHPLPPHP
jgi:hypothetical protein